MIKKINYISDEDFDSKYLSLLEPIVFKNFFEGQELSSIKILDDALLKWGGVEIGVQSEYVEAYFKNSGSKEPGSKAGDQKMTIDSYFEHISNNPESKIMCIEFPTPEKIKNTFKVPSMCFPKDNESTVFVNQCFIGNKGNKAHIHFDKAGTNGFLYQVFGRKKFIIFPKSAVKKLAPITQISMWNLQNFSPSDYNDFLKYTGGLEVILEPGDMLFVPMMCWHYADYIDHSMSISLRFRRPKFMTELANMLFPDMYLQSIAQEIATQSRADTIYKEYLDKIREAHNSSYKDGKEKVIYMKKLAKEIFTKMNTIENGKDYYINFEQYMPSLLPNFLDSSDPSRKVYE